MASKRAHKPVICAECGRTASLVDGSAIYPHRPDLHAKHFWRCECGAYCGCHGLSRAPLGSPAGPDLRKARNAAHRAFDRLWRLKAARTGCSKGAARRAGYAWLSREMGIAAELTHIGMFDADQCARVVDLCTTPVRKAATAPPAPAVAPLGPVGAESA